VCATATGTCTLRAAITEADLGDPAGPVPQVTFPSAVSPIVDPALGDLPADRVLVRGATGGTTISAAGFVHCDGTARFEDVTLLGGGVDSRCEEAPPRDPEGRIELARATLTGAAVAGDMPGDVSLLVHQSTISGNAGAAILSDFTQLVVTSSRIVDNGGGGIALDEHSGSVAVTDSVISGNQFGIGLQYGSVTVVRSLLADNTGAAIYTSAGWAQVIDSTLSGNAIGVSEGFDGTTTIRRSTLVGNGIGYQGGDEYARLELAGSIIQGGIACQLGGTPLTSYGWNVASDSTCGLAGTGDQQGVDARLGPLADNGGPTQTHLPAAGSVARDAIPTGTAGLCTGVLTDQRGVTRPQGPACDRGAVEQ
jgi:hypothetical protein